MPDPSHLTSVMEFAKFIGIGGAAVLAVAVWWLASRLAQKDLDLKEEIKYSREREIQGFTVLANLTKVYEQGLTQGKQFDDQMRDDLKELKTSIDSMLKLLFQQAGRIP